MLSARFADSLLLKGLKLVKWGFKTSQNLYRVWVVNKSTCEVCPRCATLCTKIYDHREVKIKDEPIRDSSVLLIINKRRFFCKKCQRPFTEPVHGVKKGYRTTERFSRSVFTACERFGDLSTVRKAFRCSASYLYNTLYKELERKAKGEYRPWPKVVGIDEHFFKRNPAFGRREFVTMVVDIRKHRLVEVVEGKQSGLLNTALAYIPGRDAVENVVIDLAESYRSFAQQFFPKARLVADKFHVVRLLNTALNKHRRMITGDKQGLPLRRLLLRNGKKIDYFKNCALHDWLEKYPALREIYFYKEALHKLYRSKGTSNARCALVNITDAMARSTLPEIQTLRRTLLKWKDEILAYFDTRITNATTEGYNNKAKLIKRRAYGYRSFKNYRLRLLAACR